MALATNLLTKATTVIWINGIPNATYETDLHNALIAKANAMADENKTDNLPEVTPGTFDVIRKWLDQAAAQEWSDYVTAAAVDYNVPVGSITISDIPT
jgi:hypothetical protein